MAKLLVTAAVRETIADMMKAGKSNKHIARTTGLHRSIVIAIRRGHYDRLKSTVRDKATG